MTADASSNIESELHALKAVLSALESVSPGSRTRIIIYAQETFGITAGETRTAGESGIGEVKARDRKTSPTDIRTLKEQKQPSTGIEMATLVGYYLAELARSDERSETVTKGDITKYFKQAGFPLPAAPDMTLVQAKNAGYFDSAGRGMYRLNPVGHNLVAHGLPRQRGDNAVGHGSRRRVATGVTKPQVARRGSKSRGSSRSKGKAKPQR